MIARNSKSTRPLRRLLPTWNKVELLYRPLLAVAFLSITLSLQLSALSNGMFVQEPHDSPSLIMDNFLSVDSQTTTDTTIFSGLPFPTGNRFCLPWTTNADLWWTHAPEWEMGKENDTHYCFDYIQDEEKLGIMRELYKIQFHGNCSNVLTKRMWSSGWSADFMNVRDGLRHAVLKNRPVQIADQPWHYADPRRAKPGKDAYKNIEPVCPKGNMMCYFLPISNCPPAAVGETRDIREATFIGTKEFQYYYEFATRRQTWLRKEIYEFRKKQRIKKGCTAIHVRRGDVVLHSGEHKRKYFQIRDYLKESYHVQKDIFLMTDDLNAIGEAEVAFPNYNWMYIDRPRFRGSEGGFEVQLPSGDPLQEVITLLTEFQLARQCQQLIHSYSSFATQVWSEMQRGARTYKNLTRIQIDAGSKIFSADNHQTSTVSKAYK